jgi:hypothetical protein
MDMRGVTSLISAYEDNDGDSVAVVDGIQKTLKRSNRGADFPTEHDNEPICTFPKNESVGLLDDPARSAEFQAQATDPASN